MSGRACLPIQADAAGLVLNQWFALRGVPSSSVRITV
ncbi:hypothetical protein FrEUN1fDRAFT_8093 [Parafrankia sp. EUN1f]|nr:hypothetical protein FrEUN1fDRAFT_8093 [Parafrankia sp. EUN1f]